MLSELSLILSDLMDREKTLKQLWNHIFTACSPRGERLFLHPHLLYLGKDSDGSRESYAPLWWQR